MEILECTLLSIVMLQYGILEKRTLVESKLCEIYNTNATPSEAWKTFTNVQKLHCQFRLKDVLQ